MPEVIGTNISSVPFFFLSPITLSFASLQCGIKNVRLPNEYCRHEIWPKRPTDF